MSKPVKTSKHLPKHDRWAFTSWAVPNPKRRDLIKFMVFQRERSQNGDKKVHYQGYVEYHNPYDQGAVKRLMQDKTMHLEPARESRSVNMFYCLKPNTYHGLRVLIDENGEQYNFNIIDEIKDEFNADLEAIDSPSSPTLSDVFDLE